MSKIFVLDADKRPLDPIYPAQARQLLRNGKAAVFRRFPFTIILKESRPDSSVTPLRLKLDPGAKLTGIALVNDGTGEVVFAAELKHRGFAIRESLTSRRQLRRSRRNRQTRYRKPRFLNRTRPEGWLAPTLQSRVDNIKTWVERLRKLAQIAAISQELVRFDMQLMRNPEIRGKEYQQGTLAGYETREYLLEKWGRQCAYCGVKDVPLQIEQIHPRAKGGSNSITNLTLSCEKCNTKKGTKDIKEFLKQDPNKLQKILAQAKKPLADAAAVNTTRYVLLEVLKATGLTVECGSGGLTKLNRNNQNLEKTHWLDAACVGESTPILNIKGIKPLLITANGHGTRQMAGTDKFGFPTRHRSNKQIHYGFSTGDTVKAVVTNGKKVGEYLGRVLCRATGSFDIATSSGRVSGISYKYCSAIHRKDGYSYAF
ncbi:RRXRR domain-containing protein [Desmonostoc muscorum CCALA 125]|nr:RRXRR domain-containing protein [Desmonostoc muscorum CCALA 125]